MKIHVKSILGALIFSLLFYSKSFGINTVLISMAVLAFLFSLRQERSVPWVHAAAFLFTAVMVFLDPTPFKIFVYLMFLFLFVGKYISKKGSLYLNWAVGLVNTLMATLIRLAERDESTTKRKKWHKRTTDTLKGVGMAMALMVLFSLLYQNANPVFHGIIQQIDFNFISFPWLLFTLMGYFLFLHILKPYHPKDLFKLDARQSNSLFPPSAPFTIPGLEKLRSEQTLGSIIFLVLNLLLIFFLITDVVYLWNSEIVTNAGYSQSVHQGIYALLFSIVCAIVLILIFFRGDLNFYKGNQHIKNLTYLWIGLNVILVLFTFYKNYGYVAALGFTYKRIGVFVYLLLTLGGLITTYRKVAQQRSFVYLIRTNVTVAFALLLMASCIPWDKAITHHHLNYLENPDVQYLIRLGDSNSELLFEYAQHQQHLVSVAQRKQILEKKGRFDAAQNNKSWQEYALYHIKKKVR